MRNAKNKLYTLRTIIPFLLHRSDQRNVALPDKREIARLIDRAASRNAELI